MSKLTSNSGRPRVKLGRPKVGAWGTEHSGTFFFVVSCVFFCAEILSMSYRIFLGMGRFPMNKYAPATMS